MPLFRHWHNHPFLCGKMGCDWLGLLNKLQLLKCDLGKSYSSVMSKLFAKGKNDKAIILCDVCNKAITYLYSSQMLAFINGFRV